MIFTKNKCCNIIKVGTRLKLATLIERMVLEHFVPTFYFKIDTYQECIIFS